MGALTLVVYWYTMTLCFNFTALRLVALSKAGVIRPEDVTVIEMTCCTVCGIGSLIAMRLDIMPPPAIRRTMFVITAANAVSCRLFMVALSRIPLSLTQTVRACQPLFTAAVSFAFLGTRYAPRIIACLATLFLGFSLSAAGDISFDGTGFACACCSVTMLVVVNLLTQRAAKRFGAGGEDAVKTSAGKGVHQLQFQAWTTSGSLLLLLPLWLLGGGLARVAGAVGNAQHGVGLLLWSVADGVAYHMANVGTFGAIAAFTPLTFSVIDTVRRLCVVISGFVFQGNPASTINIVGVVVVFAGAGWYATIQASLKSQGKGGKKA